MPPFSSVLFVLLQLQFLCIDAELNINKTETVRVPGGFNISAYLGFYTFCQAVRLCHHQGERILSGDALQAIKAGSEFSDSFGRSLYWWIGLVDALNERNTSRSGWMWIEDGSVTTESEGVFANGEPDGNREDCVGSNGYFCWDAKCNSEYNVLCYTSETQPKKPAPTTGSITGYFAESPILTYTQPDAGCWINASSSIATLLTCCYKCLIIAHSDCVGFYWNSFRLECILLPYFDAAVQLNYNNDEEKLQWKKFLRQ